MINTAFTLYSTCLSFMCPFSKRDLGDTNHRQDVDHIKISDLVQAILSNGKDLGDQCSAILKQIEPIKVVELIESVVSSLDTKTLEENLTKWDSTFKTVEEDAEKKKEFLTRLRNPPVPSQPLLSLESSTIFRFIANFINTFATAFSFSNKDDAPANIYEMQVLLQIYFRFFQIPLTIAVVLQPILGTAWKVYLATVVIFFAGLAAIQIYVRYLKPLPTHLNYCEDIESIISRKYPFGFGNELSEEMCTLLKYICGSPKSNNSDPLLIQGVSGIGKTTLACWLAWLIKNEDPALPEIFRDKNKPTKVVLLNLEKFMDPKIPFNTIIGSIEKDLEALRDRCRLIVFVDEAGAVQGSPERMRRLKSFLRMEGVQMVAMTTIRGRLEGITQQDNDKAFERPCNLMTLQKDWNEDRLRSHLTQILEDEADDLPWDKSAITLAMKLTENSNECAQHAVASKLLRNAINFTRAAYVLPPPDEKTRMKKNRLNKELNELIEKGKNSYPDYNEDVMSKIEKVRNEIKEIEKNQGEQGESLRSARKIYQLWISCKKRLIQIHSDILDNKNITSTKNLKNQYLFASIATRVLKTVADITIKVLENNGERNLTLNAHMVKEAYGQNRSPEVSPSLTDQEHEALKPIVKKYKDLGYHESPSQYKNCLLQDWNDLTKRNDFDKLKAFQEYEQFECAFECQLCLSSE